MVNGKISDFGASDNLPPSPAMFSAEGNVLSLTSTRLGDDCVCQEVGRGRKRAEQKMEISELVVLLERNSEEIPTLW